MTIDAKLKEMATSKNFAALTTLAADGQPSTQMMWIDADDEHLIFNTETHRQKYKNITADPRVCVTIIDAESPYRYVEVRGRVVETVLGEEARRHIDAAARRYTGADYAPEIQSERVIVKIAPNRVNPRGV